MEDNSASPIANRLFTIKTTDPVPLDEPKAQFFHHIVAKLLFLCKRSYPDISTSIEFLTTWVEVPDGDGYDKLTRIMRYLRSTQHLALKLTTSGILEKKSVHLQHIQT